MHNMCFAKKTMTSDNHLEYYKLQVMVILIHILYFMRFLFQMTGNS